MNHIPLMFKKVVDSPYPSDGQIIERFIARIIAIKSCGASAVALMGRG